MTQWVAIVLLIAWGTNNQAQGYSWSIKAYSPKILVRIFLSASPGFNLSCSRIDNTMVMVSVELHWPQKMIADIGHLVHMLALGIMCTVKVHIWVPSAEDSQKGAKRFKILKLNPGSKDPRFQHILQLNHVDSQIQRSGRANTFVQSFIFHPKLSL